MERAADPVHVFEIVQRFTHAHEDDVGDLGDFAVGIESAGIFQEPVHVDDFFQDFACFQVAGKAHLGGAAEGAVHGAAHLGGDAYREPPVGGNHHRLDVVVVVGPEKPLDGAIDGFHAGLFGKGPEAELGGQLFAEGGGDVHHLVVGLDLLAKKPFLDLVGTEGLLVLFAKPSLELVARKGLYVVRPIHSTAKIEKI